MRRREDLMRYPITPGEEQETRRRRTPDEMLRIV